MSGAALIALHAFINYIYTTILLAGVVILHLTVEEMGTS